MAVWNPCANEIFASLLELPLWQRPTALAQACGADAELQRQVESLLAAHAQAGSFLDQPAAGAAPPGVLHLSGSGSLGEAASVGELQPEGPLGDFRLVREVGRGGMGVVYEAVQISLGRRVALKVLPFAAALDAQQLQRFKNEAHAAAQLQHPNIVPVYAVGCERSVHYYAMQLIEGQNLAELIAQMRSKAAAAGTRRQVAADLPPTSPYPPPDTTAYATVNSVAAEFSTQRATRSSAFYRTAAGLAVQAAEALEHAHQLGVVHRDIKPANLLLDGQARLWVTDFGLARLNGDPGLTLTGDLVGTVRYMSPEQTAGKHAALDHRTDVYSLGATLYELLTLRPACDGRERQEVLRQILTEEPKPPRRLNPGIPADLETIVLKALEKNPSDRYATAGDLADDLRRYLDDEPILARPLTPWWRFRKWVRRRPAAAGLLLSLVLGTAISTYFAIQATRRATDAEINATIARDKEAIALQKEAEARDKEQQATRAREKAEATLARSLLRPLVQTQAAFCVSGSCGSHW
jgi:serine/threonine protein kinase